MNKLSDTQALILSAAAQRPENIALPLPESLRGGAAAKVVGAMLAKNLLQEVDADMRKGELMWRESGDGHGVTLVATDAGLAAIGIEGPQWLSDENWTKPSIVLMSLWGVGNTVVIYLAALQDVPRSLYESAELDGAGAWTKLRSITIPLISPVIYFNLIMGIIGSLQVFAQPFVMLGGGGPNRSALFYAVYLYQNAFEYRQMGYACSMAWVLFILILILTWAATRTTRRHIYYAGE